MRIVVDMAHELRAKVQRYADDEGVQMSRAYREIIEDGLEANGYDVPGRNESDSGRSSPGDIVGTAAREVPKKGEENDQ